jgi:glycosyltransferase involved in cell wall biosynthesis
MKISIALCTFNGERFLKEQLSSIAGQTRPPDEIVICDDRSDDRTWDIIQSYHSDIPFSVKCSINEKRLGSTKNFEKAVSLCTGDLIALCDQDDVWMPHKIEAVERRFLDSPGIEAVFSDGNVVDEKLSPLGYTLWHNAGFSKKERKRMMDGRSLEVLLKHVTVTGATLVFRRSLAGYLLPIPPSWVHDAWIGLLAATGKGLGIVSEPLILYRQHGKNQIGARSRGYTERFIESLSINRTDYYSGEIARYDEALKRASSGMHPVSAVNLNLMEAKLIHLKKRAGLPESRLLRIIPVIAELLSSGYQRFSFGWQVAVKDLLLPPHQK